jgi:hypothetical protein
MHIFVILTSQQQIKIRLQLTTCQRLLNINWFAFANSLGPARSHAVIKLVITLYGLFFPVLFHDRTLAEAVNHYNRLYTTVDIVSRHNLFVFLKHPAQRHNYNFM